MASILRVDTLTDASSNNSTAMSTINQGTAKAWINFNGAATGAVGDYDRDSFNMSVTVDGGTGNYTLGFTSNLSNANYSLTATCGRSQNASGTNPPFAYMADDAAAPTTAAYRLYSVGNDGSLQNQDRNFNTIHGDLA